MGALELQIFVGLVVVLGAAFAALICDFLKGNNEQLREANLELRVRQEERERLQQPLAPSLPQSRPSAPAATPMRGVAHRATPAFVVPETGDEARALFERASGRRRAGNGDSMAQWANELLEKKKVQDDARIAELKARLEPEPVKPAPVVQTAPEPVTPAPVRLEPEPEPIKPAPVVEAVPEPIQPAPVAQAVPVRVEPAPVRLEPAPLPIEAAPLPVEPAPVQPPAATAPPVVEPVPPAVADLAQSAQPSAQPMPAPDTRFAEVRASVTPEETSERVPGLPVAEWRPEEPFAPRAFEYFFFFSAKPQSLPPVTREAAPSPLPPQPGEPFLPVFHSAVETLMPEPVVPEEQPVAEEETPPVAGVVPVQAVGEEELAPVSEPEALASQIQAMVEPVLQPGAPPLSPALPLEPMTPAPEPLLPQPETPRPDARGIVVELPVTVHTEPEIEIPGGLRSRDVLDPLLVAPEVYTGLAVSVGVVDYPKLVSEHGKPAVEQVLAALERTLHSVVREQDLLCRTGEDEWLMLCPHELAAPAKRRTTLLSERLWDFQLRSLGGLSIFFSWGAAEGQQEKLAPMVARAREEMEQSRHMRRGAINLAPRSRRRVVNA